MCRSHYKFSCKSTARTAQAQYNLEDGGRASRTCIWTIKQMEDASWMVVPSKPRKAKQPKTKRNFGPYKFQSMANARAAYNKEDKTHGIKWKGIITKTKDNGDEWWELVKACERLHRDPSTYSLKSRKPTKPKTTMTKRKKRIKI